MCAGSSLKTSFLALNLFVWLFSLGVWYSGLVHQFWPFRIDSLVLNLSPLTIRAVAEHRTPRPLAQIQKLLKISSGNALGNISETNSPIEKYLNASRRDLYKIHVGVSEEENYTSVKNENMTGTASNQNFPEGQNIEEEKLYKFENESLPLCPEVSPYLRGAVKVSTEAPDFGLTVRRNPALRPGGLHVPRHCRARHRAAIIVPYRARLPHLRTLLHNLHPVLTRQQLHYVVLVVEQAWPSTFNKGLLMNVGAVEALRLWPHLDCLIFHDVDLLPEDDRILYRCLPAGAVHLAAAVSKFRYRLPYKLYFGGVTSFDSHTFVKINGYSNLYFGWGAEDDDMFTRLRHHGVPYARYPPHLGRYTMIRHDHDLGNEINPYRFLLFRRPEGIPPMEKDGLNSLRDTQYVVEKLEFRQAYTWILVSVDMDTVLKAAGVTLPKLPKQLMQKLVNESLPLL